MLFEPLMLGERPLANRIVMAPMTRSRTDQPGDRPNSMMATYYRQRARAGMIVSEGAPISPVGRGYSLTPGIYTQAQIEGWKQVTDAVHEEGGTIFIQLWHVGRRSHSSISGEQPVSASATKVPDQVYGPLPEGGYGMIETETPRAMTLQDIQETIDQFVQASKNALQAGFDGVEIHAAHGYLFDSFLRLSSNQRTDQYGGDQENRMRFLLETLQALVDTVGGDKVAVRLSPHVMEGFAETDPEIEAVVLKAMESMQSMNLAYVHFSENISSHQEVPEAFRQAVRRCYTNPVMVAGKLTKERATELLEKGYVDLVAFGTAFISNPDLVARLEHNRPLAEFDQDARLTLYGGGEQGYIDYPAYPSH